MSDVTILKERRSIRKYKAEPITERELDIILEAGMNRQTPIIVAIRDKEVIDRLEKENAAVMEREGTHPFYGAPTLVVVFADSTCYTGMEDACLVMGNLMNAAESLGVGSIWIHRAKEEFDSEFGKMILKKLGIEGEYEGIGHCALGYAAEPAKDAAPRKENYVYCI